MMHVDIMSYNTKEKRNSYMRKYKKTNKFKLYMKKVRQLESYKKWHREYKQIWDKLDRQKRKDYYRLKDSKHQAKRKRDLGFIQILNNPFADSEIIDWHHMNDVHVVAIPRDLHQLYYGKYHRENTMEIIKQIYEN